MLNRILALLRSCEQELEATLHPTSDCQFGGNCGVEMERFTAGHRSLEIDINETTLPDGTAVDFIAGGQPIVRLRTIDGCASKQFTFQNNDPTAPEFNIGDVAEIRIDGNICYSGIISK